MKIHGHAAARMRERGAGENEIAATIDTGERFIAKFGREGFRRNFAFGGLWRGRRYHMKQIEVYAVWEDGDWLVISVVVKYF